MKGTSSVLSADHGRLLLISAQITNNRGRNERVVPRERNVITYHRTLFLPHHEDLQAGSSPRTGLPDRFEGFWPHVRLLRQIGGSSPAMPLMRNYLRTDLVG